MFNLRIQCEKYLQYQQNLKHVFFALKKPLTEYGMLLATMRKYNVSANLFRTTEQLYDKATNAGQMNGSTGEWFEQSNSWNIVGCLLSPIIFNISSYRSCLMLWKNVVERSAYAVELLPICDLQEMQG